MFTVAADKVNDGPDDLRLTFTAEPVELGTDPDTGEVTTAPVAVARTDPDKGRTSGPVRPVRLSDAQKLALRHLHEALADFGRDPPPGSHAPRGVKAVHEDEWRSTCYRKQISASGKQDTQSRAFRRAAEGLQVKGVIGIDREWVWALL
jgi:hypothetical protein